MCKRTEISAGMGYYGDCFTSVSGFLHPNPWRGGEVEWRPGRSPSELGMVGINNLNNSSFRRFQIKCCTTRATINRIRRAPCLHEPFWMFDVREIRGLPWFTAVGYGLAFHVTDFMLRGRIFNEDDQHFYMVLNIFQCFAMYGVNRCM